VRLRVHLHLRDRVGRHLLPGVHVRVDGQAHPRRRAVVDAVPRAHEPADVHARERHLDPVHDRPQVHERVGVGARPPDRGVVDAVVVGHDHPDDDVRLLGHRRAREVGPRPLHDRPQVVVAAHDLLQLHGVDHDRPHLPARAAVHHHVHRRHLLQLPDDLRAQLGLHVDDEWPVPSRLRHPARWSC